MSVKFARPAALLCAAVLPAAAHAQGEATPLSTVGAIVVTAAMPSPDPAPPAPATVARIDAATIATTINAVSIEDTLKYLPSLVIRKRHVGDNFAPIATRTSGLGSSARSLVYADGVLLSALVANNNANGSPRWTLVAPEDIERIDVIYGPFSAAYPGNSIGTTVLVTTRLPDKFEAGATVLASLEPWSLYGTDQLLTARQASAHLGDRFGPLTLAASMTRTVADSQPLGFVAAASLPPGASGGYVAQTRTGAPTTVLGATGIEHHVQDTARLKAALDLGASTRLTYSLGLWRDDSTGDAQTYVGGWTPAFSSGVYRRDARHVAQSLALARSGAAWSWRLAGSLYRYARDRQDTPTGLLPAARTGGAGTVLAQDGTGWGTLDGDVRWRGRALAIAAGAHVDRVTLVSQTYAAIDWIGGAPGSRIQASLGKTRTAALWAEAEWHPRPALTVTLGARQEWWRAFDGFSQASAAIPGIAQPERRAQAFSPKAALAWHPDGGWTLRLSLAEATRFPTVGELYQAVTVGTVLANPDPTLRPERARSGELAIEHKTQSGSVRAALFDEVIDDALISQSGTVSALQPGGMNITATATYVQNVDRTRARGFELAYARDDLLPRLDLSASLTFADAITSANGGFPAAVGKLLPSVPRWKGNVVLTWRPDPRLSLTAALRAASRNFATLDNSDTVESCYTCFGRYAVVDVRAVFRPVPRFEFALGVDNLGNDKYVLFHPFPQRTLTASASWRL